MMGYHLKVALSGLWREKWINFLSTLSVATGLFLIAVAVLAVYNIEMATRKLPEKFAVTVYLKDGLSAERIQDISREISRSQGVKSVNYVSKDEALEELKSTIRDSNYILEGLDDNPLPASITISLDRVSVTDSSVVDLVRKVEGIEGVSDVEYGRKLLTVIETARRNAELLGGFLISSLSAALIFICYSTVKILFYRKREEVETLKLLGATRGFIRAPFIIEGGVIGLGGGLLGASALGAVIFAAYAKLDPSLPFLGAIGMPPELFYWLPAGGLLLGVVGSYIAIGRVKF